MCIGHFPFTTLFILDVGKRMKVGGCLSMQQGSEPPSVNVTPRVVDSYFFYGVVGTIAQFVPGCSRRSTGFVLTPKTAVLRRLPSFEGWSGTKMTSLIRVIGVVGDAIILVGVFFTARFSPGHLGSTLEEKSRGNQSKLDADSFITLNSGECDDSVKTTLNARVHFNVASSPEHPVLKELGGKCPLCI
ncbi:hypothetical protein AVEN_117552-1 [Araneus ventricosus]|uniref:Uncharacterized protein n=1 Tax=Araneus ventricosus TaxID=182803 RepID=A0A4Y2PYY5_ARAVE|nr:hypothetical protein AVEN_117552-1 [Araneus ventricosus]